MDIFVAVLLGVVQGLTEFLPVSSSGHLVLLQKVFEVFGITGPTLFFDTMVHVGTLAAVFAVLWRDIWAILRRLWQPLTAYLVIATIPAVIFALAFKNVIESAFESGVLLGFSFLLTAVLLSAAQLLSERACKTGVKGAGAMNWKDALVIGILQAIAVIPGVSRSGATLSGALSRKLDRDFAARFSFLLSIPAILGAVVLQVKDIGKVTGGGGFSTAVIAGTIAAGVTGFFAIRLMLKIVREKSLWAFVVYTAVLGTLVLVDQNLTRFVNWL